MKAPFNPPLWCALPVALACSQHAPEPVRTPDAARVTMTPANSSSIERDPSNPSRSQVEAVLRGTIVRDFREKAPSPFEICPGTRAGACPGVSVVGEVADGLVSTKEKIVPVAITGWFDGDKIRVQRLEKWASDAEDPSGRFRNPCPHYQTPVSGPTNGSDSLRAEMERLQKEYPLRIAGIWWDQARQTLTVRVTGDGADIEKAVRRRSKERLCVVGGAQRSRDDGVALVEQVRKGLEGTKAVFLEGEYDEVSGELRFRLEAIDSETRRLIAKIAGDEARIVSFIELTKARLESLPTPHDSSEFPLATSPARSATGMLAALGKFALQVDREKGCIYLAESDATTARVMPSLPFGYTVHDRPLRLVDYDGHTVAVGAEATTWGGGFVGAPQTNSVPSCGAESVWSGVPLPKEPYSGSRSR